MRKMLTEKGVEKTKADPTKRLEIPDAVRSPHRVVQPDC